MQTSYPSREDVIIRCKTNRQSYSLKFLETTDIFFDLAFEWFKDLTIFLSQVPYLEFAEQSCM